MEYKDEGNEGNEDSKELEMAQLNNWMVDPKIIETKSPNCLQSLILRLLPPEIISCIFDFTLLDLSVFWPPRTFYRKYKRTVTPFTLGAVCRDWRAITWSTPVLWSSMAVYFSEFTLNSNRSILVKDWLSRSGQLPLSIRIFFRSFKFHSAVVPDLKFLAGIIKQYSSRWRHFELSTPSSKIATFFGLGTEGPNSTPMLESLQLNIPGPSNLTFDLVTCPRLQKVHLISVPLSFIRFSWDTVTHICMQYMLPTDYLTILRNTPLLVYAEFIGIQDIHLPYSRGEIIIPLLRSLKVVGMCATFFLYITCPTLHELICDAQWSDFDTCYIIPFLERSGPLRSFSMFDFDPHQHSQLIDLLRGMPSLKELVLSQKYYGTTMKAQNILKILGMIHVSQSNPSQPRFLPHLETFDYKVLNIISLEAIDSLPLSADNAIQGPLQSVKLNISPAIHMLKNNVSFFLRLIGQGVTVNVCSRSEDILQSSIDYHRDRAEWLHCVWLDELDLSLMQ